VTKFDREPTYNLKVVVQETGVKPDTLRVWERRYGLPEPDRTPGGHRLYSDRDIAIIKWLMARKAEGMSISRAVVLWQSLEAENADPLHLRAPAPALSPPAPAVPTGAGIAELRHEWVAACLNYDEQRAEQIATQAFALYPPEAVTLEILQKGIAELGDRWYQGEVTVQQEHFASALAIRRLDTLIVAAPPPSRPGRILVACPPQEEHIIPPLMMTFFLRRRGWDVLFLGANVPLERLESALATARPKLAILSAQQLFTAASLLGVAGVFHQARVPLAFGGRIFNLIPELRRRIPGHFLGERLDEGLQTAEYILTATHLPPVPAALTVPTSYEEELAHYRRRRPHIEAHVTSSLEDGEIPPDYLSLANLALARNLVAALRLGDTSFLGADLEWIEGLPEDFRLPADQLASYLRAYRTAAAAELHPRGRPIIAWLDRVLAAS
jgi:MerR family transcriptional regulator, light-induced transcriptional regulator